jgi:hypothetical protein
MNSGTCSQCGSTTSRKAITALTDPIRCADAKACTKRATGR